MKLFLIRHGQTINNAAGNLDTAVPGATLTDLGHAQAAAIPQAFADTPIAGIHVSELDRTHLTAAPLAAATGLEVQPHPGFNEISAGSLEGNSDPDSVKAYIDLGVLWARGDLSASLPDGEDGHTFFGRFTRALEEVTAGYPEDANVVLIGHGAAIRVFSTVATGLDPEELPSRRLWNTGMVTLAGDTRRGWELLEWSIEPRGGAELADAESAVRIGVNSGH